MPIEIPDFEEFDRDPSFIGARMRLLKVYRKRSPNFSATCNPEREILVQQQLARARAKDVICFLGKRNKQSGKREAHATLLLQIEGWYRKKPEKVEPVTADFTNRDIGHLDEADRALLTIGAHCQTVQLLRNRYAQALRGELHISPSKIQGTLDDIEAQFAEIGPRLMKIKEYNSAL